jgi:hypothetical protein
MAEGSSDDNGYISKNDDDDDDLCRSKPVVRHRK